MLTPDPEAALTVFTNAGLGIALLLGLFAVVFWWTLGRR